MLEPVEVEQIYKEKPLWIRVTTHAKDIGTESLKC